jgi:hypothetical protein
MPNANYAFSASGRIDTGGGNDFPIIGAYRGNTYLTTSLAVSGVFRSSVTNTGITQFGDITTVVIFSS